MTVTPLKLIFYWYARQGRNYDIFFFQEDGQRKIWGKLLTRWFSIDLGASNSNFGHIGRLGGAMVLVIREFREFKQNCVLVTWWYVIYTLVLSSVSPKQYKTVHLPSKIFLIEVLCKWQSNMKMCLCAYELSRTKNWNWRLVICTIPFPQNILNLLYNLLLFDVLANCNKPI